MGRFNSSRISADAYLPAGSRYVELNPVRAGIVADPGDYRWSGYGGKTGNKKEAFLDFDPCYMGLADNRKKRAKRYMEWVKGLIPEGEWELIRQSLQRCQLTGSVRFVEEIEHKIERRVEFRGQGRSRKS